MPISPDLGHEVPGHGGLAPHDALDLAFETGGARLRYRDEGAGPALLFIHGWGFDLEVWLPQAAALSGSFRVLRYDRRGFGLSTGTPSLARDLDDAVALLDHCQLPSAVVIGASQGARVALRAALAVPERVRGLVLEAPPDELGQGRGALTDEIPLDQCRALARQGDMPSVRRLWLEHPFTRLVRADPAAQRLLESIVARYPGADLLEAVPRPEPLRELHALAVPTLVLNGASDLPSRIESGVALANAMPGARHHSFAGAGHLANLDDPKAYEAAIRAFVEELSARDR
jgi:pimeloyl-ACP methyl ester carboxylesterase